MTENEIVRTLLTERIRLSAAIWTVVRDTHAAEDIMQELVVKALEERERFSDDQQLLAWARTVARHRAIDHVRIREGRARILSERVLDLLGEDLESQPDENLAARLDALKTCLERLPSKSREMISLRYTDGLCGQSVADKLRKSRDAVYQSLSRIHKQLRACIEQRVANESL
ncbi:MAG: sigma-70 family RNA polymerase sigma factor [Verrucomicrobiota bacterium]